MKKMNTLFLIALISILPLVTTSFIAQPVSAQFSSEFVGDFDGLEPGESLEYKLWMPQDLINWLQDPETLESFLTVFNNTFWNSLLDGLFGLNASEVYWGLQGIFELVNEILQVRLGFDITEVIQPNTTDLYPYGHVQALMDIKYLGVNETYGLLQLLGIIPYWISIEDFIADSTYYSTDLVMDIDALSFLTGQPYYPDGPELAFPVDPTNITYVHYQPDDVSPYPLDKFDDFPNLYLHANLTNSLDTMTITHNGTGTFTTESFDMGWDSTFYWDDLNTTKVDFGDTWTYQFFVNDTYGYSIVTPWYNLTKDGPVGMLPIVMPNDWLYWAGYLDGFLGAIDLLMGLFLGYDLLQSYEFFLDNTYETSNGVDTQTHNAVHAYVNIDMGTIVDILFRELIGFDDFDLTQIFLTLNNYTDWIDCFHLSPIQADLWFEDPHGFALKADININLTHVLNKFELFAVRLLNMMSAPYWVIGNVTAALAWLKIGEIGIGTELTWYEEIPEPMVFEMPWWLWIIIGAGAGAGIAIAVIYARTRHIWIFERTTLVST